MISLLCQKHIQVSAALQQIDCFKSLKDYVETEVYEITVLCALLVRDLWSKERRDLNPLRTAYITIH